MATDWNNFLDTTVIDESKAAYLLAGNHPTQSLALFYAGIAGVFLFLSGVIQGALSNRVVYSKVRARLLAHRRLQFLGARKQGFVDLIVKNLSGIISNVFLGFMLGSAGILGIIFGIPFDIRHIAFSSAHVGAALLDAPHLVSVEMAITVFLGVLGIGLVNFLLSFGLTLSVALKSRNM